MPLPALPANNTDRVWLKYTSVGEEHEICWRVPNATTQADVITQATALANALKANMLTTDSFNGLRHQDNGSLLSFPLAFSQVVGTSTWTQEADEPTKFMALSGRSLGGYRCKITFFTPIVSDAVKYRALTTAGGGISVFYNAILAMSPAPVAIDAGPVIWNAYVNTGYNAYWQRRLR